MPRSIVKVDPETYIGSGEAVVLVGEAVDRLPEPTPAERIDTVQDNFVERLAELTREWCLRLQGETRDAEAYALVAEELESSARVYHEAAAREEMNA